LNARVNDMAQLYCTWAHRANLLSSQKRDFGDLDYFISDLLSKARDRLLVVAPYLSTVGMNRLRGPMAAAAESGAWIRLVTTDLTDRDSWNYRSILTLISGSDGQMIRRRLRVLCAASESLTFIHAKLIVADSARGYLGSANLSAGGLDKNFEVGVALLPEQAEALERLVDTFETQGLITDISSRILSD
jgi:phosphatidylserine/phosphatidylglycerophosphate/cardiolipin synthase-like enzyme